MSYPHSLRQRAHEMRKQGSSIPEITKKLGIAKSTVSLWVRSVQLPKAIRDRLLDKTAKGARKGLQVLAARRALRDLENQKEARAIIRSVILKSDKNFWKFCTALIFWCEGSKRSLSSGVIFTNSDPLLVRVFLYALRTGFKLDEERFAPLLHLHEYHNETEQLKFWSTITGIPSSQFTKPYRKPNTKTRIRENYPGCISIRYRSSALARKLDALYHILAQRIERA